MEYLNHRGGQNTNEGIEGPERASLFCEHDLYDDPYARSRASQFPCSTLLLGPHLRKCRKYSSGVCDWWAALPVVQAKGYAGLRPMYVPSKIAHHHIEPR